MREFKQAYPLEVILKEIGPCGKFIDGDYIRLGGLRLFIFKEKGTKCVACGLEGAFWLKERDEHSHRFFMQLYAVTRDGGRVLMTKDHIKPLSKGGKNYAGNLQTMCATCNSHKGDQWIDMPIQSEYGMGQGHGHWDKVQKPKVERPVVLSTKDFSKPYVSYNQRMTNIAYARYQKIQQKKKLQTTEGVTAVKVTAKNRFIDWLYEWRF